MLTRHIQGFYDPSPPDPVAAVAPLLDRAPGWFVIGGLGDGDEARCARALWPSVRVLGVDVDPRSVRWQLDHGWPAGAVLINKALSDRQGRARANLDEMNCASLHPSMLSIAKPGRLADVETTTLDILEVSYGPFTDCLLWLDLEGHDMLALRGAVNLLSSGRVLMANVETRYEHEAENRALNEMMGSLGYFRAYAWFRQWWGHNEVWLPGGRVWP